MAEIPQQPPEGAEKFVVPTEYPAPIDLEEVDESDLDTVIYPYLQKLGLQNMPGPQGARSLITWLERARSGVKTLEYYKERVKQLLDLEQEFAQKQVVENGKRGTIEYVTVVTLGGKAGRDSIKPAVHVKWEKGGGQSYNCVGNEINLVRRMVKAAETSGTG